MRIRHAEFLALIDVGRALHHVEAGREHLGRADAVLGRVVAEHRDASWLVVVVPVERVPGAPFELGLPFVEDGADVCELWLARCPFFDDAAFAVLTADVFELENHAEFFAVAARVFFRLINRDAGCFADGQQVVFREHALVHFLQEFMDARAADAVWGEIAVAVGFHGAVREALVFRNHADDVHAEAVDALVAPECHEVVDLVADFWVLPVEIDLFFREEMEVILTSCFVILPRRAREARFPVVWLFAVLAVAPDVVVAIGIRARLAALDEPGMFVGRVVDDEVHDNLDAGFVCGREQRIKILHRAEILHDGAVVGDVVAVVIVWRGVDGREPDDIDAEL